MSSQDFTLMAKIAQAMPRNMLTAHKQFWIDRPVQLAKFMHELSKFELQSIYESPVTIKLNGGTFDPGYYLLNNSRVLLEQEMHLFVKNRVGTGAKVSFLDKQVRYTHTKNAATNSAIRRDLPEKHVFEGDPIYIGALIANILKYHHEYGHNMGLVTPGANIFYANVGHEVFVVEIADLYLDGSNKWEVSQVDYGDEGAWSTYTRVFFPSYEE